MLQAATGRERRRRFVYVTKNTEYHVMDKLCVAVRDRSSGGWRREHQALRRRLAGGITVFSNGAILPSLDPLHVGQAMYFVLPGNGEQEQLVTSRLERVARPNRAALAHYPNR